MTTRPSFREIDSQWIQRATVDQASAAFFRINQGGTKIDATEIRILRAKNSPLAVSSRAIARAGAGHAYWSSLTDEKARSEVPKLGKEISELLFTPPVSVPIKTLDVPVAGLGYGAHVLPLVFDVVATANGLGARKEAQQAADLAGLETKEMLRTTRRTVELLCSNKKHSLGLHPALYFYNGKGQFHAAALTNALEWFKELEDQGKVSDFLRVRSEFEALLLKHPTIAMPAANKLGAGRRSRPRAKEIFSLALKLLQAGKSSDEAWAEIVAQEKYAYLATDDHEEKQAAQSGVPGGDFHRDQKSGMFFAQALPTAQKCELCRGLLHVNGMVADHIQEKSRGGTSATANGRWIHPRCNSEREVNRRSA